MRDRIYRSEAVIIRRNDFGEADRLLTLVTPRGKQRVIAKGARKTTSRLAGHIELFTHTMLLLAVGRTFDIVTQSNVLQSLDVLRADLRRISAAYYAAELIDRLISEDDESRSAFELLVVTLAALNRADDIDLVLRYYELHLLSYTGYRPHAHFCANCQERLTEEADRFSPRTGGVICPRCSLADRSALPMSLTAFKLLRYLQSYPLEEAERLKIAPATHTEVEGLLRAYIREILERELKSVAFLEEVRSDPVRQ